MARRMSLEDFREAVRDWLHANVPRDLKLPSPQEDYPPELVAWTLEFRRKLGARGWLGPSWPTYLGGGGLPGAAGAIVMEELRKRRLPSLVVQQTWLTPLRVWGTEEQKARWLIPTLRGEITVCQIVSEPGGGADLATKTTTALRDGDEYVVNGEMGPISSPLPPDYLFLLVNTDPQGTRYQNLAMIIVDAHDPGVTVRNQRFLTGRTLKNYALNNVRIPPENIVGGERGGWEVAQCLVEVEHGEPGTTPEQRRQVEERERRYWIKPAP